MKKTLVFLALGFVTSVLMASLDPDFPPPKIPTREPTPVQGFPVDDVTLRGQIFDIIDDIWLSRQTAEDFLLGIQGVAKRGGVTPERMTKMLERIIREGQQELKTAEKDSPEHWNALRKVIEPIRMLSVFHGPDTIALLQECARSEKGGRTSAMRTYISIVGAVDALPFIGEILIGEIVAKKRKDSNPYRGSIFECLEDAAKKLANANKDDDVLKVYIFLMGIALLEYEPNAAAKLDHILCSALSDYVTSVQRAQTIEKIAYLPVDSDYFKKVKTEISKTPVSKRRDYTKQPLKRVNELEMGNIRIAPQPH